MLLKVVCVVAVVAAASAGKLAHSSQYIHKYDDHHQPKYEFEYAVEDHHTGDIKRQQEQRDGDHVRGYYALHQPHDSDRKVNYHGDHHSGFNADVKYSVHHVIPYYHHHDKHDHHDKQVHHDKYDHHDKHAHHDKYDHHDKHAHHDKYDHHDKHAHHD